MKQRTQNIINEILATKAPDGGGRRREGVQSMSALSEREFDVLRKINRESPGSCVVDGKDDERNYEAAVRLVSLGLAGMDVVGLYWITDRGKRTASGAVQECREYEWRLPAEA